MQKIEKTELWKTYIKETLSKPLTYFITCHFGQDLTPDYDEINRIKDPKFYPEQDRDEFKKNLADIIINSKLPPEICSYMTSLEGYYETQDEVDVFLINEIWKPLYSDEPIKI